MVRITFVDFKGSEYVVDAVVGTTLMEAGRDSMVPGIEAECGGACACGTCHVILNPEWVDRVTPLKNMEETMLELTMEEPCEYSRLACQIDVTEDLDGMVVTVPEPAL